jgi:hypothetical protein
MRFWESLYTALQGRPHPRHGRLGTPKVSPPALDVPSSASVFSRPLTSLDEAARLPSAKMAVPVP